MPPFRTASHTTHNAPRCDDKKEKAENKVRTIWFLLVQPNDGHFLPAFAAVQNFRFAISNFEQVSSTYLHDDEYHEESFCCEAEVVHNNRAFPHSTSGYTVDVCSIRNCRTTFSQVLLRRTRRQAMQTNDAFERPRLLGLCGGDTHARDRGLTPQVYAPSYNHFFCRLAATKMKRAQRLRQD